MGDTSDIVQQLHDSGINAELSSFCDEGWTWRVGGNGIARGGDAPTVEAAILALAERAARHFPRSAVAAWWRERRDQLEAITPKIPC